MGGTGSYIVNKTIKSSYSHGRGGGQGHHQSSLSYHCDWYSVLLQNSARTKFGMDLIRHSSAIWVPIKSGKIKSGKVSKFKMQYALH